MKYEELNLRENEKILFSLRALFEKYGYSQYKVSKFEEYDFYMKNKSFLVSENVLTFTDTTGKLMALKPDVTLSIVKNTDVAKGELSKVYYSENVYRTTPGSQGFKEIMQTGLECIGNVDTDAVCEVLEIAAKSLETVSDDYTLDISHAAFLSELLSNFPAPVEVLELISSKNAAAVRQYAEDAGVNPQVVSALETVTGLYMPLGEGIERLFSIAYVEELEYPINELKEIYFKLREKGIADKVYLDMTMFYDMRYYNGVFFKGFINGIPDEVLSGGRYDNLLAKMGKKAGAIGFAVYTDRLERLEAAADETEKEPWLNIALPKGRLGEAAYEIFEKAGFSCPAIREKGRKLTFENPEKRVRYFWVKPSDVAIYVERGAADLGVAGKDILLEYEPDVYELSDLGIGKCRMAVAGFKDFSDDRTKTLRVATKFPNIAKEYYADKSREIDIIKLNGSIELAPILGLSDVIVDIVETGNTLLENDLVPLEDIVPISARLISNKVSYKFKNTAITELLGCIDND